MTRLLTIRNYPERYGAESHLFRVAIGTARQGWEVHAAFPQTEGMASLIRECAGHGIHYHPFYVPHTARLARTGKMTFQVIQRTIRLLKQVAPEVVQVTFGGPKEAFGYSAACGLLRVPSLFVFQLVPQAEQIHPWKRRACDLARARNQHWVAVSQNNLPFLSETFQIPPQELGLLYNGIETRTEFSDASPAQVQQLRRELRQELGLPDEARLLLTMGRLSRQKGYYELLEVVEPLTQEFPNLCFLWVGTGEERESLEQQVRQRHLEKAVRFLGYRSDVPRLLKGADLFVFPTRFEGGCSAAIRESLVHELPIVSTDVSGIPEVVEHGRQGLLFPLDSPQAMRESLRWAIQHPDAMRQMALNGRQRIALFSAEKMVQDYLEVFERLLQQGGTSPQAQRSTARRLLPHL